MNTKPDDVMLALWLDDELDGAEFTAVEAWAATQPEQLAAREETRRWRKQMAGALPREIEPAYPDFFNSRIMAGIAESRTAMAAAPVIEVKTKVSWWRSTWFLPATAAAGIALGFLGGVNVPQGTKTAANNGTPAGAAPVVYTPDNEVKANYFAGKNGSSTVIVLDGVSAIPDTIDFRETAWISPGGDIDSTASTADGTPVELVR